MHQQLPNSVRTFKELDGLVHQQLSNSVRTFEELDGLVHQQLIDLRQVLQTRRAVGHFRSGHPTAAS